MKQLYINIRNFREELNMSQEELAQKVGYKSRTSIAKIESGKVDLSNSKIEDFAKAFGISSIDLIYADSSNCSLQEVKKINKQSDGYEALVTILNDIYGKTELCEIFDGSASCFYYSLDAKYGLSDDTFIKLYDSLKPIIRQFTDLVKVDIEKIRKECELSLHKNQELLNAAHERTDIDIPEGTDTSDNDIMDDENF